MTDARNTRLTEFDQAHDAFRAVIERAPEGSLGYLKPGDNYARGGLVHHVNATLEHYLGVLESIVAGGFRETQPADRPGLQETANAMAREGLGPGERDAALADTARLHRDVAGRVAALAPEDFERTAQVRFEPGAEPYPTSAAAILGWLTDHYQEHVPQAEQLLSSWQDG